MQVHWTDIISNGYWKYLQNLRPWRNLLTDSNSWLSARCSADLPYSTSESSLHEKFSNFGQIAEGKSQVFPHLPSGRSVTVFFSPSHMSHSTLVAVKLVKDENTKRSRGFAFIQFTSQDDAMLALENMDNQVLLSSTFLCFLCFILFYFP